MSTHIDSVVAHLRAMQLEELTNANDLQGMEAMRAALEELPQYKSGVSGIILEKHTTAGGFRRLADSVLKIVHGLLDVLESPNLIPDVALLTEEPIPGMFPYNPRLKSHHDRTFVVVKLPLEPKRGHKFSEYAHAFLPGGDLGLQGLVIEHVGSMAHGESHVRLHLSIYDSELRWYTIDTSGVMHMTKYGCGNSMHRFIDMGVVWSTGREVVAEVGVSNIDWRIAVEKRELKEHDIDELMAKIPQWLPLLPQVMRDTIALNEPFTKTTD